MHAAVASPVAGAVRRIVHRTPGRRHGPITRLVSPSDVGQLVKPFVFLDRFALQSSGGPAFGMHPHSGIATLTVVLAGAMHYRDTTGKSGTLAAGGVEWMRAGGGVWHDGEAAGTDGVQGFQLWVALPPEDENAPAYSQYLAPQQVQADGPVRVILGRYGNAASAIETRASIDYLHVQLKDGEHWRYTPRAGHTVAWVSPYAGQLQAAGTLLQDELAVFEPSGAALDFVAVGDTSFMLGSAVHHPHDLVMGSYSVHTDAAALARGEAGIERIGAQLQSR